MRVILSAQSTENDWPQGMSDTTTAECGHSQEGKMEKVCGGTGIKMLRRLKLQSRFTPCKEVLDAGGVLGAGYGGR